MVKSSSDEEVVKCPIDGCNQKVLKRGLFMHIYQTDDSPNRGHDSKHTVPEDLDLEDVKISGSKEVQMDYPDTQNIGDAEYFDTYTGKAYKGKRGLMVHLGQMAGQDNIPSDVTDRFDAGDFPIVETDDGGNIINVVKWGSNDVPPLEPYLPWYDNEDLGYIRRKKIREFVTQLKERDGEITADEIEKNLL